MRVPILITTIAAAALLSGCLPRGYHRDEAFRYFAYAVAAEEAGDDESAADSYRSAAFRSQYYHPDFGDGPREEIAAISFLKLGRMSHEQGNLEEALDHYAKARAQMAYGTSLLAQIRRSRILAVTGERETAANELRTVLEDERVRADQETLDEATALLAQLGGD
jgi:tetratricopeptide (TPR) repeat protein